MGVTGLAANPTEYRSRLREQSDDQIDAWSAELMRDVAARRGVVKVVTDFKRSAHLDDRAFARVYARGGRRDHGSCLGGSPWAPGGLSRQASAAHCGQAPDRAFQRLAGGCQASGASKGSLTRSLEWPIVAFGNEPAKPIAA